MVKYPVSESSFREIINGGYLYVDKTQYIHQMKETGKFYFLSRPRRFGKSLLISTMENYFRGRRELFRGLAIDRLEPEQWTEYPVLHLDFTRGGYNKAEDLTNLLDKAVSEWENEYGTPNPSQTPDWRFDKLIRDVCEKTGKQVVVLIDEYDSPVVDVADHPELVAANRKGLHDFYRVMKANSDCLKFVFLTGVGKLGQINIFSGLNNIKDISLDPRYSAICGITTEELASYLKEGIDELGHDLGVSYDEALQLLKNKYDGYHFSRDLTDIYNPFSLVNAMYDRYLGDYWFQSGTPTRLINSFLKNDWGRPDLEGTTVSASTLMTGNVLGDDLALSCYYTGYLTIKSYDSEDMEYTLGYPNSEVKLGFSKNLVSAVKKWDTVETDDFARSLRKFIKRDDIDGFLHELQSFLAGIPYMNNTNTETQWQKDILIVCRLLGMNADVESRTSDGRIDMVLESPNKIYIIEFKYGGTPEEALKQIEDKRYALRYENSLNPKEIVKVGVNISPETRNIDGWAIA